MTGVRPCPAEGWQQHRDAAPHRLAGLSQRSDLSLGRRRHWLGQLRGTVPPAPPSTPQHRLAAGGAQLLTFCPPGPRAPGKPVEPFSPCSPLAPCKQKPRSTQGRRETCGTATAWPWWPSDAGSGSSPCWGAKHRARVPTSTSTWGTGMPPRPGPSPHLQPSVVPKPAPPSPAQPPSPIPSLQACLAPPCPPCRLPCPSDHALPAKEETQRGVRGWGGCLDACWDGEDSSPGAGTQGSVGWLKERGQCALRRRVPWQQEAPPALLAGKGVGGAVLCHWGEGLQDQTRRAGSCPGPGAGQAGPWGGGCTGEPLPISTRGMTLRVTRRMGTSLTGSPLLPRAPMGPSTTTVSPCMPKAGGLEVSRGASTAALPPIAHHPRDSPCLLWALGTQRLPERKGRW